MNVLGDAVSLSQYGILKALHILLVPLWIGSDIGTYLSFHRMTDSRLSVPTRLAMARLFGLLDQGPRSALVLLAMLGVALTHLGGWGFEGSSGATLSVAAAVMGALWLGGVWYQYWVTHPPAGSARSGGHVRAVARYRTFDLWWRILTAAALSVAALASLARGASNGPISSPWLSFKLLLFAAIIAVGVRIRVVLPPIVSAFGVIAVQGSTVEREVVLQRASKPARRLVKMIWALLVVITALAVIKPT